MIATADQENLTRDQQVALTNARLGHYMAVMGITFAVTVVNLFLIFSFAHTAPASAKLALALSVFNISCFGALAGGSTLQEIKALNQDYNEAKLATHHAKYVAEVPTDLFAALTVGLIVLIGFVQLWMVFTV
ncbi:hypothetical protein [Mesorhizobium silamurunense]|uniref:hypothetical protein n=1 Tax=Mesorhizobium silamurunense TaxID=499528 RepID=UPI001786DEB8|nr:hypothetical protein [Mesorhizobium silamurunense]